MALSVIEMLEVWLPDSLIKHTFNLSGLQIPSLQNDDYVPLQVFIQEEIYYTEWVTQVIEKLKPNGMIW